MSVDLRPLAPEDRDRLLAWRNADHVRENMYDQRLIPAETHAAWFADALAATDRQDWIIRLDEQPVGLASLYAIDREAKSCSWAFYIGEPDLTGRGVGSAVERQILALVFEEMGFEQLNCEVLERNTPVLRLHARFGFEVQHRLPARAPRPEGALDAIALQLTRAGYKRWKDETP